MELMTSRQFFGLVATLSPAEVLRLQLAARPGSTVSRVPPCPAAHERDIVLPGGAGVRHGGQGDPGTGKCEPDETPPGSV